MHISQKKQFNLKTEIMKTIIILLLCVLVSTITFGQVEKKETKKIDTVCGEVITPEFLGVKNNISFNEKSLEAYLQQNIKCPDRHFNLEGTEVVRFTITPAGKLEDFKIINSVSSHFDEEVIGVLKTTNGMWAPGYKNGIPVAMEEEISLVFKLDETDFDKIIEAFTEKAMKYYKKGSMNLIVKNNPKKAIRNFDMALNYLPYDCSILLLRSIAKNELDNKEGAQRDWVRMNTIIENGTNKNTIRLSATNIKM